MRVLCWVAQLVQLFQSNELSTAAALPPKPLLSTGLSSPPQVEKLLVASSCHLLRPCPMVRTPSLCTPSMLPACQRAGWDEGNGCAGTRPHQDEDRMVSQLFPEGRSPLTDRVVHPREPWL